MVLKFFVRPPGLEPGTAEIYLRYHDGTRTL